MGKIANIKMLKIETLRNGTCAFFRQILKRKIKRRFVCQRNPQNAKVIPTKNIEAKITETPVIFPVTNLLFYLSLDYRQLESQND